ncbi:MAG: hypothetical protein ACREV1_06605 [Gammaproteobacteria bacterium]
MPTWIRSAAQANFIERPQTPNVPSLCPDEAGQRLLDTALRHELRPSEIFTELLRFPSLRIVPARPTTKTEACGIRSTILADHDVEVVADRGIDRQVAHEQWEMICCEMEKACPADDYQGGALTGIRLVSKVLARFFPAQGAKPNELPDQPVLR